MLLPCAVVVMLLPPLKLSTLSSPTGLLILAPLSAPKLRPHQFYPCNLDVGCVGLNIRGIRHDIGRICVDFSCIRLYVGGVRLNVFVDNDFTSFYRSNRTINTILTRTTDIIIGEASIYRVIDCISSNNTTNTTTLSIELATVDSILTTLRDIAIHPIGDFGVSGIDTRFSNTRTTCNS